MLGLVGTPGVRLVICSSGLCPLIRLGLISLPSSGLTRRPRSRVQINGLRGRLGNLLGQDGITGNKGGGGKKRRKQYMFHMTVRQGRTRNCHNAGGMLTRIPDRPSQKKMKARAPSVKAGKSRSGCFCGTSPGPQDGPSVRKSRISGISPFRTAGEREPLPEACTIFQYRPGTWQWACWPEPLVPGSSSWSPHRNQTFFRNRSGC